MSFIVLMRSTLVIKQQTGLYKHETVNNLTPRCSSSRCCVGVSCCPSLTAATKPANTRF